MGQLTLVLYLLLVFILDRVTPSPTPDASLLCISECGTCPLICSPPPSPVESKPPPSPTHVDLEPPPYLTPIYHPTPPQSSSQPSLTPPPHPQAKSCPPPSYITMGTNAPPPPPPPPKLVVVPSTQIPPSDGIGVKNYSYPYYYFYASKGASFSLEFLGFLMILFISFLAVSF